MFLKLFDEIYFKNILINQQNQIGELLPKVEIIHLLNNVNNVNQKILILI